MQRGWAVPWQGRVASVVAAADASLAPAARLPLEHGVAPAVMATVPSPSTEHPPIQHLEASEPRYVGTPEMTTPVREELERLHSIAGAQFRWRPSHRLLQVRRVGRADLVATAAEQAEMASGNRLSGAPALPRDTAPLRQWPGWLLDFELLGEGSAKQSLAFDGVVLAVPRPQFEVLFGAHPRASPQTAQGQPHGLLLQILQGLPPRAAMCAGSRTETKLARCRGRFPPPGITTGHAPECRPAGP